MFSADADFHTAASRLFPSLWGGGGDEVQGAPGIVRAQCGDKRPQAGPRFFLLRPLQPRVAHADPQAAKQPQRVRRVGRADAAAVFIKRRVQALVEGALDAPIVPSRPQQGTRVPTVRRRASQQQQGRAFFFLSALDDEASQLDRLGGGGETDLFGCDGLGAGATGFVTALVAFQVRAVILEARDFSEDAGPLKSWAQIDQLGICPYHPERRDPAKSPPPWNGAAAKFVRLEWVVDHQESNSFQPPGK